TLATAVDHRSAAPSPRRDSAGRLCRIRWRRRRRRLPLLNLDLSENRIPVRVAPVCIHMDRHASEQRRERNLHHCLVLWTVECVLRLRPPRTPATVNRGKVARHVYIEMLVTVGLHFHHMVVRSVRSRLDRGRRATAKGQRESSYRDNG